MRDKHLLRELMFKLKAFDDPPSIFTISMHDPEMQVPGYTPGQIYSHLRQIEERGYILYGDSGPSDGIGFGGFTESGHDYLEEEHAKEEEKLQAEAVPANILEEIIKAVAAIRGELDSLKASNSEKAEVAADLSQLATEIDRPKPRRSFIKLFIESARDNLAKAGGAGIGGAAMFAGGIIAKWLHWN